MILKIAKAELRNLFYSPTAWLIIIAFYVLCGYQLVNPLVDYARVQEAEFSNNLSYQFGHGISVAIFADSIRNVLDNLYLFIPLLTMGIINREASSGSIKLLYSSPIRTRDIVFGKYLGLVVFNLVLILVVAILFATGYITIIHAQIQWYLAIVLALFLIVNTYVAIGVFMSSLTSYQLVAAILTFILFFILQQLSTLWQSYDFFRDLTYFLTMTNKAEVMINGLITSRDVLYFILITVLFLGFTLIKLKSTQESKSWKVSFTRYTGFFLLIMVLGYFSSRSGAVAYWDVTRNKERTLHPNVQDVFKKLDGSLLTVTLYTNLIGTNAKLGLPVARNRYVWNYMEMFMRSYPNIKLKYEYYYDFSDSDNKKLQAEHPNKTLRDVARIWADIFKVDLNDYKRPEESRKLIDLTKEDYRLVLEFEYKGKRAIARTYDQQPGVPSQSNVAATILRLIDSTPKVVFTTGHFERSPNSLGERGYATVFNDKLKTFALINNGVDTDTLSLMENDIPDNTNVLVIADPKTAYSEKEKEKISNYLSKGGNAFILGEPGKQFILNEILEETGVKLDEGIIVYPRNRHTPDLVQLLITPAGKKTAIVQNKNGYTQRLGESIVAPSVANLSYIEKNGYKIEPLYEFSSDGKAWIERGLYVADSAAPIYSPMEGDEKKPHFDGVLQLTRTINNKEQRIVISGDADHCSNFGDSGPTNSYGFMNWLLYERYPIYSKFPPPIDKNVKISFKGARVLYVAYVYVIPALIFLVGMVLLIRRKRK